MSIWWNSATADEVWAILGDVLHGCNASVLFSFDRHRRLILDLVSSVHQFTFQRRSVKVVTEWTAPAHSLRINTENQQYLSKYLPLTGCNWRKHSWHQLHGQIIIKEHWSVFFPLYFSHELCQTPKIAFLHKGSQEFISYPKILFQLALIVLKILVNISTLPWPSRGKYKTIIVSSSE